MAAYIALKVFLTTELMVKNANNALGEEVQPASNQRKPGMINCLKKSEPDVIGNKWGH